jgi:hypothetical protein
MVHRQYGTRLHYRGEGACLLPEPAILLAIDNLNWLFSCAPHRPAKPYWASFTGSTRLARLHAAVRLIHRHERYKIILSRYFLVLR